MHDSMEEFLELLAGTNKSEGTVDGYRRGLDQYSSWLEDERLEPDEATPRDIKLYLSYLKSERDYAPFTIRHRYSAVSEYYKDYSDTLSEFENPVEDVRLADYAPPTTRREEETKEERVWMTKDEVTQLVENVPAPKLRNRLVILFQYFTGLRVQEVSDVKLSDLDLENRQVQVRGKNNEVHTAHWQPKLDGLLTAWIDGGYRAGSPYATESDYLFLSDAAPYLRGQQINKIVVKAAKNAGIQEVLYQDARGANQHKITSHALRHSFAMHWLENGGSIEGLSKHMAHSSVTTTEIYGEILDERAKEEYEKYAPDIELEL
jgi:integrase/recombinase XerD